MKIVRESNLVVKLTDVEVKGLIAQAIADKLKLSLRFVKIINIHQSPDRIEWVYKNETLDLEE